MNLRYIYDTIIKANLRLILRGGAKLMPNIKSAKKRVKVIEKKTLRNNKIKSAYKTAMKKFEIAVSNGDNESKKLFLEATKKVDQACSKGIIKKNSAARKKSKLSKLMNTVNV